MHEWGIAYNLIEKIVDAAKKNDLSEVKRVNISLGKRLGITKEEFLFCLTTIAKDDPVKKCEFVIEENDSGLAGLESIEGE